MIINFLSLIRRFWLPIISILVVILIAAAFFFGRHSVYQAHPELSSTEQAAAILAKVGTLIELPQGEAPQMATIDDAESAKVVQPFLSSAQNGDILIVYASAQIALLYRPSANKLIAVGPITNEQPSITPPEPEVIEDENATTTDEN